MSHITLGQQGLDAAEARRWDEAITKLSTALQASPNPAWLIARSKALIGTGRYAEALDDAALAWHKAFQRNRRPLLVDAHYRRAVAYFRLGEHANADCCCVYAMRLIKGESALEKPDPKTLWTDEQGRWTATLDQAREEAATDPMNQGKNGGMDVAMGAGAPAHAKEWRVASTLRMQILGAMEKLPADHPGRKVTTSLKPEEKELSDLKTTEVKKTEEKTPAPTASASAAQPAAKAPVPSDAPLRVQEFQSSTAMNVSIFTKGVNKEKLQVDFLPLSVRLMPIVYPNGDEKGVAFDLWAEIDPAASKYNVTPNKVELTLAKKTPGKWQQPFSETKQIEQDSAEAEEKEKLDILKQARKRAMESSQASEDTTAAPTTTAPQTTADKGKAPEAASVSSYPTSSASGPKNWDSIVGAEGGDKSDDEDGKDVNFFFKKLFKNATPEQQRAMMKSFTESNGTSLSTDWDDVKGRTVETVPPEGVEAKKWD